MRESRNGSSPSRLMPGSQVTAKHNERGPEWHPSSVCRPCVPSAEAPCYRHLQKQDVRKFSFARSAVARGANAQFLLMDGTKTPIPAFPAFRDGTRVIAGSIVDDDFPFREGLVNDRI